jgi:hypothetical protein
MAQFVIHIVALRWCDYSYLCVFDAGKIGNRKKNSTVTDVHSSVWTAYHNKNWEQKEKLVTCTINDLCNVLLLYMYLNLNIW